MTVFNLTPSGTNNNSAAPTPHTRLNTRLESKVTQVMYNSSGRSSEFDNTGFAGKILDSDIASEQQLLTANFSARVNENKRKYINHISVDL